MSFATKKNLGQNFLIDEKVIDIITNIANIDSKDEENTVKDYQLNRAIELIRSINVYENIKKAS